MKGLLLGNILKQASTCNFFNMDQYSYYRAIKPFINEKNLLVEQVVPSNPVPVQLHVNMLTPSMQAPPFSHESAVQSSISADRNIPCINYACNGFLFFHYDR